MVAKAPFDQRLAEIVLNTAERWHGITRPYGSGG